jgi:hypothetical protein
MLLQISIPKFFTQFEIEIELHEQIVGVKQDVL